MDVRMCQFEKKSGKDISDFINGSTSQNEWSQMNKPQNFVIHWNTPSNIVMKHKTVSSFKTLTIQFNLSLTKYLMCFWIIENMQHTHPYFVLHTPPSQHLKEQVYAELYIFCYKIGTRLLSCIMFADLMGWSWDSHLVSLILHRGSIHKSVWRAT